ncbi:MAG TPA: COX15/CtaA family protein [Actinomycetota bacterium]|nr:COX15/CtaA family protein [Actinomycetota bacterium]
MAVDTAPDPVEVPRSEAAPQWLRRIFWANLVAQIGIVITGGIVRVTGSGLGCPTWPECVEGSITPTSEQTETWHRFVEFGNRTLTGVLMVLAVAALVGVIVWRRRTTVHRTWVFALAAVPLLGTIAQAVLGGITVLVDLHPMSVAGHLLLSMAVIAGCVALVQFSAETTDPPGTALTRPATRILGNALIGVTAVILVMGTVVTGSGPHAGDAATVRLNLDPRLISWLHADVVLLFIGLLIGMLALLHVDHASPAARRRAWWVVAFATLQASVGYVQYFTGLPWVVVTLHLLGACLVWAGVWFLRLSLTQRGNPTPGHQG